SNTNSITLNFSNGYGGGFICVQAVNSCGNSGSKCLSIPVLNFKPSKADITGPELVCAPSTVTYCASASNATSYSWSTDHGLVIISGQGTSCIQVSVPANYTGNGK